MNETYDKSTEADKEFNLFEQQNININEIVLDFSYFLIKNKNPIILNSLLGFVICTAIIFSMPKIYNSTTTFIAPESLDGGVGSAASLLMGAPIDIPKSFTSALGLAEPTDLFITLLKSRKINEQIIKKFNLMEMLEAEFIEDGLKKFADMVEISAEKNIITISVDTLDPKLSNDIASEFLTQLSIISTDLNVRTAKNEREFLEKRIKSVHDDLIFASKKLTQFQVKNKLIDIQKQGDALITNIAALQTQIITAESELSGLKITYTENSPRILEVIERINSLKRELSKIKGNSDPTAALSEKNDIGLFEIPSKAIDYIELTRDVKIQEQVFELLIKQYELAKIKEARDQVFLKVIDAPEIATKKAKPKRMIMVVMSFVVCLIFVLTVYLLKYRIEKLSISSPVTYQKYRKLINDFLVEFGIKRKEG